MFSRDSYDALRAGGAFVRRADRGALEVSGPDRTTWLQGLLTNDVVAILVGQRAYSAWLTPQGRMITDLWVVARPNDILLDVPASLARALRDRLDELIFAEDVRVEDVSDRIDIVWFGGADHYLERGQSSGLPAREADLEAFDVLRIEEGIPKFLVDMDERTIPLEAGIEDRAISYTKGCYVGQEVIVRVTTRGQGRVARRLVGLLMGSTERDGLIPELAGAAIRASDRDIGRVTSAAVSPQLRRTIALGYVHRDFTEPGTEVRVGGGTATVTSLPFVTPAGGEHP
jgi:hypothetical protein